MDISIITITKRYGGIDILVDALSKQDHKGKWEWILVDELYNERHKEVEEYVKEHLPNIEFIHTPHKMTKPVRKHNLVNSLNTGLLRSHGELIVWLQDYIWVQPDSLSRYWTNYNAFPNRIIGGLKNHYSGPVPDNEKGLVSIWNDYWEGDPVEKCVLTEKDDRYKSINAEPESVLVESLPIVYEMCNASMPYALAVALNGLDEKYDEGRGYDNQNLSFRAKALGYATVIDMCNIAREFNHWEYFGHNDKVSLASVDNKPHPESNYELHGQTMLNIQALKYPLRAPNNFVLEAR